MFFQDVKEPVHYPVPLEQVLTTLNILQKRRVPTVTDVFVSDVTKWLTSFVASQEYQSSSSWPVVPLPRFSFASFSPCSIYGMPQLSHPAPAEPIIGQPSNAT